MGAVWPPDVNAVGTVVAEVLLSFETYGEVNTETELEIDSVDIDGDTAAGVVIIVVGGGVFVGGIDVFVAAVIKVPIIASCTNITAICRDLTSMSMGKPYMEITPENEGIPRPMQQ